MGEEVAFLFYDGEVFEVFGEFAQSHAEVVSTIVEGWDCDGDFAEGGIFDFDEKFFDACCVADEVANLGG